MHTYLTKRRYQRKKALIHNTNHNARDEWQNDFCVVTVNDEYTKASLKRLGVKFKKGICANCA